MTLEDKDLGGVIMELIDKSALIAKIEEKKRKISPNTDWYFDEYTNGYINALKDILSFLNTLEVKEVDLKKELEKFIEKEKAFVTDNREVKYYNGDSFNHIYELEFIAKHFFELGLAQKGE